MNFIVIRFSGGISHQNPHLFRESLKRKSPTVKQLWIQWHIQIELGVSSEGNACELNRRQSTTMRHISPTLNTAPQTIILFVVLWLRHTEYRLRQSFCLFFFYLLAMITMSTRFNSHLVFFHSKWLCFALVRNTIESIPLILKAYA